MSEIDCNEVLSEIQMYVDREVEVVRFEQIEVHLGMCSPCLGRAEFRAKLKEIISSRCCSEVVPTELAERIRGLLATEDTA